MPCIFCNSFFHVSNFCDKYVSNKSRPKSVSCCNEYLTDSIFNGCTNRENRIQCFACFSEWPHTVSCCPEKLSSPNYFFPKIDKILINRFIEILGNEGRCLLALFSRKANEFIKPEVLTVVENNKSWTGREGKNLVITNFFYYPGPKSIDSINYLLSLKSTIFRCKKIDVRESEFTAYEFTRFLSPYLLDLNCFDVFLSSTVTFSSVIEAAPNMESFNFYRTNVKTNNSWPDSILKWKKGKVLSKIRIPIKNVNFDVKSLLTVIKEKCTNGVKILLNISYDSDETESCNQIDAFFTQQMETYFASDEDATTEKTVRKFIFKKEKTSEINGFCTEVLIET